MTVQTIGANATARATPSLAWIMTASCAGSVIEWYDFYLYGSLAVFFGAQFFPKSDPSLGVLLSVATMSLGFVIRPLGGLVFGAVGDYVGRKYTFLLSLILMGLATTLIGLLPTYASIGIAAPLMLIGTRLLQGLAVGGEVGSAATYIAENAPDDRRGLYTGIFNTTATGGTMLSLLVILACRNWLGDDTFNSWGWRLPFLFSALLVIFSVYLRLRLSETPIYEKLMERGSTSKHPIRETFANPANLKVVLLAIFGVAAGQAALGITGNVYALQFMQAVLKVDMATSSAISMVALLLVVPVYVLTGWLSDVIGRRKLIITGLLLAAVFYVPIYMAMKAFSNPVNAVALCALLFIQLVFTALVVGPTFAFLTEVFPARIRTTSVAVAFNVGNGVIGGLSPFVALWLTTATGNPFMGLAYPIALALITAVVNLAFLRETYTTRLWAEVK
jgi:MFS family permease